MSDLIKRSDALKPYEGLGDNDLISVRTIRENLVHMQAVDFEDEAKCSTCKHDFGEDNCGDCEWDSVAHTNTNWEPRVLEEE
jgi:hypothetical protein